MFSISIDHHGQSHAFAQTSEWFSTSLRCSRTCDERYPLGGCESCCNDPRSTFKSLIPIPQGLRGVAAVFVVSSHIVLCYARGLIPPCCAPSSNQPYLFQRPILRLVASGHSWVAIFFLLMGFVNALKPLQLARSDQVDKALQKLASSSFSRIFRLILPATAATIISWFICNLGLYSISTQSDAYWLHENTPKPSSDWASAFFALLQGLKATWVYGIQNPYDQPQWALIYLLQGSIMIISVLSLVVAMTPLWRTVILLFLAYWSINWSHMLGDREWANVFLCSQN